MTKILVSGAAGHLGGLVIKHLLESEKVTPGDIVAGSRNPEKLTQFSEKGIETRRIDFDDPTLADALAGIDRMLIISTDELAVPGKRLEQHRAAVNAAARAGVGRLFYTSLPVAEASAISFAPDHHGTEQAIEASGVPYTILRNNWYMENLFLSLPAALASGQWYTSAGAGKTAFIAREDIARATAAALASPPKENAVITLTGEKAYSNTEIAALASKATGKPLAVVDVTDEQLAEGMIAHGVPAAFVPTFVSFDTAVRKGDLGIVGTDAARLARTPLKRLEDFLAENAVALTA